MAEQEGNFNDFKRLGTKYVLSVMAACVAEFATYPLDLTKTRLQIQGNILQKIVTCLQYISILVE